MSEKLTDEEAAAMLARLSEHFREPVMPVGRYCNALQTWSDRMIARFGGYESREAGMLNWVALQIRKSCLLARMIYGGEDLRTRECPDHKGQWSGIGVCRHGCEETGWIPNDWPDAAPRCSAHEDRPAVSSVYTFATGETVRQCWACYLAKSPFAPGLALTPPTPEEP